jgi:GNAT superfamily N-acetyltransferase
MVVTRTEPGQCHAAAWGPRTNGAPVVVALWLRGRHCSTWVGQIVVSATTGFVSWVEIAPQFRGMGIARKLYGEAARIAGVVQRDPHCSPAAGRVWDAICRSPQWRHVVHDGALFARPTWPHSKQPTTR